MSRHGLVSRIATTASAIAIAAAFLVGPVSAVAQTPPKDLTVLPPP